MIIMNIITEKGGSLVGAVPTLPSSRFDDHFGDVISLYKMEEKE